MKKKTSFIAVMLITGWLCLTGLYAEQPPKSIKFDHLTIADGLSQGTISYLLQDKQGFIWIGTLEGLHRYDGYSFKKYISKINDPTTVSDNEISHLYEDRYGILWVTTVNGLNRFNRATETFTRYHSEKGNPNSLNNNMINGILEDKAGNLWIAADKNGLNKFNRDKNNFTRYIDNTSTTPGNTIYAICIDKKERFWVGTLREGLKTFDIHTGKFSPYPIPGPFHLKTRAIISIFEDHTGILWLCCSINGLFKFNPQTGLIKQYINDPANPHSLSINGVTDMLENTDGTFWLTTIGGGLNHFAPKTGIFTHYLNNPLDPASLNSNNHYKVIRDRTGILWFGSYLTGIDLFNPTKEKFMLYNNKTTNATNQSLLGNDIRAILEDHNGILWISSFESGLNKLVRQRGTITYYSPDPQNPKSIPAKGITGIIEDKQADILWLSTSEEFLLKFDTATNTFTVYDLFKLFSPQLPYTPCLCITQSKQGLIWIGTLLNGVYIFNPQTGTCTTHQFKPDNTGNTIDNMVESLFCDRSGNTWIGTRNGLWKYVAGKDKYISFYADTTKPNGLSSNHINTICESKKGVLWIGTHGNGLAKLDEKTNTFTCYSEKDGLPNNTIYAILEDEAENLWISTNRGITRFNPQTLTFQNFSPKDGLQDYQFCEGYFKSKSGEMFFGGVKGMNSFFPAKIKISNHIPPLVFTSFKKFNQEIQLPYPLTDESEIELSYKDTALYFEFSALDYADSQANQYAYKVESLHNDWIFLGNRHYITMNNLYPGTYKLRIKGANSDGVWNEKGISLRLQVNPPPWQTWWFKSIILALAAAAMTFVYKRRIRYIAKTMAQESRVEYFLTSHNISPREKEIIDLVVQGKTNKEIEDALFISLRTVKTHIYNIFRKLEVKNRLELITKLQEIQGTNIQYTPPPLNENEND